MKYVAVLLFLASHSAFADEEYYLGDSVNYVQKSPDPAKKLAEGEFQIAAGTFVPGYVGGLSTIGLKISDTQVSLNLSLDKDTLGAEKRKAFLEGKMITLSSGRKIQFFHSFGDDMRRLLIYLPEGGLSESIDLIPKRK